MRLDIRKHIETVRAFCSKWYLFIILLSIVIIFRKIIVDIVEDKFLIPLFEPQKEWKWMSDGNFLVLLAVLAPIILYYFIKWCSLQKEGTAFSVRRQCILFVVLVYSFLFRFSNQYVFYGYEWLKYSDCLVFIPCLAEVALLIVFFFQHSKPVSPAICPFYPDLPTGENDLFGRESYVKLLIGKISKTFLDGKVKEGAFTILLNEPYGSGKSSFFRRIKKNLKDTDIICVEFNLLSLVRKDDIATYFFKSFLAGSGFHDRSFEKAVMAYSKTLSAQFNAIETLFGHKYESLESQYEDISNFLKKHKRKIVILVDDVDRLQNDEMLAVLKLIRTTASFPNVIYMIAADKSALIDCLKASGISDGDIYLKKFFNMELLFPASYHSVLEEFYEKLSDLYKMFGLKYHKPMLPLQDSIFSNMRDVYRYLNLLSFSMEFLKGNDMLKDICIDDLVRLTLVQFLDASKYRILREHDDYFLVDKMNTDGVNILVVKNDGICSRSYKENQSKLRRMTLNTQDDEQGNVKIKTLDELILDSSPTADDVVADLIRYMFDQGSHHDDDHRRICFESEYYKYFAGSYRHDEWTNARVFSVMGMDDDSFKEKSENRRNKGELYWDSYLHKISGFVKRENYDQIKILKKIIILVQVEVDYDAKKSAPKALRYYYNRRYRTMIDDVLKLNRTRSLLSDLAKFFDEDTRIHHLSLILSEINTGTRHSGQNDDLDRWEKSLIERFIRLLTLNPFDIEISDAFYDVKCLSEEYFNKLFHEYLLSSADPLSWLFRFVKIEKRNLVWNRDYWYGMLGDSGFPLYEFAIASYTDSGLLTDELASDIKQYVLDWDLAAYSIEKHPYLKAAKEWWLTKGAQAFRIQEIEQKV